MNDYEVEIIAEGYVAGGTYQATSKAEAVHQAVEDNGWCYKEDVKYMSATNCESDEADALESDDIEPLIRKYKTEIHTSQSAYYDEEEAMSTREAESTAVSKIHYKEVSYIERVLVKEVE